MSNADFLIFVDPDQYACRLLIVHMFLLDYIMGQFMISPELEPKGHGRKYMVISWVENVVDSLPTEYQKYAEWSRKYCKVLAGQDARYLLSP